MIRVLLVDDQAILRQALEALLERESDMEVVGSAGDGQTAIEQVAAKRPDVILIDIQMPGMDGLTATRIICQRFTNAKVIVLSGHDDNSYLINALRVGAKGYLLKSTAAEDLVNTIRTVHKGYGQFGPGLLEKMMLGVNATNGSSTQPTAEQSVDLSVPEPEFKLLLAGFDAQELIAAVDRVIEQKTVDEWLACLDQHLRQNPKNLAALYLSGALSHRGRGQKKSALPYLKFGFKEGLRQQVSREGLVLFYREAVQIKPEEAFDWIAQVKGPWDSQEGVGFLLQEAAEIFGPASTRYRNLLALWRIKAMVQWHENFRAFKPKLELLQEGFERLDEAI
ncbi:MAG: response regulator transcription factor [Cyanothece sp. SIO1E1]|nr:response regulator transcription factor [Cyanothece sp. SIO1E1]